MKCPTCGKADLEQKDGPREFRGQIIHMRWKECPECHECLYTGQEVREAERKTTNPRIVIMLEKQDWDTICEIMRSLTWGKHDISDKWHAMRERINERMFKEA